MVIWPSIASLRPSSVHPGPQRQAELAFDPSGWLSHLTSMSMVTLGALLRQWSWPFLPLPYFSLGLALKMPPHPFHDAFSALP